MSTGDGGGGAAVGEIAGLGGIARAAVEWWCWVGLARELGAGAAVWRRCCGVSIGGFVGGGVAFLGEAGEENARADFVSLSCSLVFVYFAQVVGLGAYGSAVLGIAVVADCGTAFGVATTEHAKHATNSRLAALFLNDASFGLHVTQSWDEECVRRRDACRVVLRDLQVESDAQTSFEINIIACILMLLLDQDRRAAMERTRSLFWSLFWSK